MKESLIASLIHVRQRFDRSMVIMLVTVHTTPTACPRPVGRQPFSIRFLADKLLNEDMRQLISAHLRMALPPDMPPTALPSGE